ncbi:SGNH/GDSL hydrolase family protein [Streptomyces orinoci]|uniref:SGNH/GDSL hydrolase family protein n=1 Tax=Streptomyces orinoci TaxID=67339 RepID=A0ABV3JZB2_STRON|nr:SGNH/GDSL hydrolase family protein [Streptomyces orinoci]
MACSRSPGLRRLPGPRSRRLFVAALTGALIVGGAALPAPASATIHQAAKGSARGSVVCTGQPSPATARPNGQAGQATSIDGTPCATTASAPVAARKPPRGGAACTAHISGAGLRCYKTYREAITAVSAGRIKDAPINAHAAVTDAAFLAEMDRASVTANNSVILSTEYKDRDFGGESLTIYDDSGCTESNSKHYYGEFPSGWDNTITSFKTFGTCQEKHFSEPNSKGDSVGWDVGAHDYIGDAMNDRTRSVQYSYAEVPTNAQLLQDCGKATDSCDFHPANDRTTSYTGQHEVTRAFNCSSKDQIQKLTWSDTQSGSNSVSTEISVTAGMDFLEKFEVSFKTTYSHEWAWQKTVTNETDLTVPAGQVGMVYHSTALQSAGGEYELHYGSKHWGHYIWYVTDFKGTGPIPDDAGVTTWKARPMTGDERASQCGDSPAPGSKHLMVMGDSISQGMEDDYTWRYRLWDHLRRQGLGVDFVGPHIGTTTIPRKESTSRGPVFDGGYHGRMLFNSNHDAQWGWQAAQAKSTAYDTVNAYHPDYLLLELGFNDLGWFVSGPSGLGKDMSTIISEARRANPDITILVANVVQRTPLGNRPDLPGLISDYDNGLGSLLSSLDTARSPVRLVDIARAYDAAVDSYDGLHPNERGEFRIAAQFAEALKSVGVGKLSMPLPTTDIRKSLSPPSWVTARTTDGGIDVSWEHVYGAGGYVFWQRDVTANGEWVKTPYTIAADSHLVNWLQNGHTYEFMVQTARGDIAASAPSPSASAVANSKLPNPPRNIAVSSGPNSIDLSWDAPTGDYSDTVNGYDVLYADSSVPGSWMQVMHVTGRTAHLANLQAGHTYLLGICSTSAAGQGLPAGAPATKVGGGPAAKERPGGINRLLSAAPRQPRVGDA